MTPRSTTAEPLQVYETLDVAEAVARRICHDFAGLVCTLSGVMDLVGEEPDAADLAQETAGVLAARLRLLRGAWGGAGDCLDPATIRELSAGLPGIDRLQLSLEAFTGSLEDPASRICLCLLLVAAASLPRGGAITVQPRYGEIAITIAGPVCAWPAALTAGHTDEGQGVIGAHDVATRLCRMVAGSAGWQLSVVGARASAARLP